MSLPRFFIYALLDPDSYQVKYIGQSAQGINRFNYTMNHYSLKINSKKNQWIKNLLDQKKIPLFKILEVCNFDKLNELEVQWISRHENLLNVAKGGIGGNTGLSYKKWKPVVSKNIETGEIKEYEFVWQVAEYGFDPTKVSAVCLGKRKTHKGHYFVHKGDKFCQECFVKPKFHTKKMIKRTRKDNLEETFFDSIKEAAIHSNVCITTVSNSCRKKSENKNYVFEYV